MRTSSRAEQVVHHGQLQQLADIGELLLIRRRLVIRADHWYFSDGLVYCLRERLKEIRPLNTANAAGGWWCE
ncbi:hypothetical protein D3C84_1149060 [compost metagenome]